MIQILSILSSTSEPVVLTDVWVRAGQSNMLGNTGGVAPLAPYVTPNPNAQIIGTNGGTGFSINTFTVLDHAQGTSLGNLHGAEPAIAYNYAQAQPGKPVYLVKVSQGSTSLAVDWASGSTLRNELIAKINTAKVYFEANGINPRWIWSWNQWENDMIVSRAPNYEVNYQGLVNEVLSSTEISFSEHLIFKVNPNSGLYNATWGPVVLTAQTNNAALYGGQLISGDDLSLYDGNHYGSLNYHIIGDREYAAIYP